MNDKTKKRIAVVFAEPEPVTQPVVITRRTGVTTGTHPMVVSAPAPARKFFIITPNP